jgi:hypothetical protein
MNEYNVIIDLAMDTIINKFKIVLPQNLFIEYYYFILYFLDIYLI